jgi:hypothetical protein
MLYIHSRRVKARTNAQADAQTTDVRCYDTPTSAAEEVDIALWDSSWETEVSPIIEQIINQIILEFIDFPYLHRVADSIHCEFFRVLASHRALNHTYPMGKWSSQPLHKGWPCNSAELTDCYLDLCVFSPTLLRISSVEDFREGRIRPVLAIEIGLDDDLIRLKRRAEKLQHNGQGYLIHLVREEVVDDFEAVEAFLRLSEENGIKTAYVRMTETHAFYKLINGKEIKKIELSIGSD